MQPTASNQLSLLRMVDMYVGLRRRSRTAAVYLLRHRVRGWNPDASGRAEPDPVVDARWALDQVTNRHGDVPVALLGHSMGGRTSFAVAADRRVVGVCALAPWLPDGEPLQVARAGQRFVLAHGTADAMASAPASLRYATRLRAAGAAVVRFELAGAKHSMLNHPALWHRFAVTVSLGLVGDGPLPTPIIAALRRPNPENLRLPLESFGSEF